MAVVSLDRLKARSHDFDDLVVASRNELGQRRADASLVIGYQHAHERFCRTFRASAANNVRNFLGFRLPPDLVRVDVGKNRSNQGAAI